MAVIAKWHPNVIVPARVQGRDQGVGEAVGQRTQIAILHRSKTPARRGATPKRGQPFGSVGKFFSLTF